MKYKTLSLIALLAFSSHSYPIHWHTHAKSSDLEDLGKVALGAAGVVAAGYGIYKVGEWLFGRTDQQVIDDVNRAINSAFASCDADMQLVARYNAAYELPEPAVYELALSYFYKNVLAQSQLNDVNRIVNNLESEIQTMNSRFFELEKRRIHDAQAHRLYIDMYDVSDKASKLVHQLWKLRDVLSYHMHYFNSYELESRLLVKYEHELRIVENYAHDGYAFDKMIRGQVIAASRGSYPYMTYGNTIKADADLLCNVLKNVRSYPNRLSAAQELYNKIDFIKRHILSDSTYMQEVRDYEREQLERQRLAAQQAHVWAMQQQANALREQNKVLQRANDLKSQQLRWQRASCQSCYTSSDCVLCDDYWYCRECVSQYNYTPTCEITVTF